MAAWFASSLLLFESITIVSCVFKTWQASEVSRSPPPIVLIVIWVTLAFSKLANKSLILAYDRLSINVFVQLLLCTSAAWGQAGFRAHKIVLLFPFNAFLQFRVVDWLWKSLNCHIIHGALTFDAFTRSAGLEFARLYRLLIFLSASTCDSTSMSFHCGWLIELASWTRWAAWSRRSSWLLHLVIIWTVCCLLQLLCFSEFSTCAPFTTLRWCECTKVLYHNGSTF